MGTCGDVLLVSGGCEFDTPRLQQEPRRWQQLRAALGLEMGELCVERELGE
jgi:hypothetical protein